MEEECLSKISIQGGPTSMHCDPNDKNFEKEVRTLKLLPSSLRAHMHFSILEPGDLSVLIYVS